MEHRHICFLHVGMARDGAERVIAHIANEYAAKGYKVDIIVLLLEECGYELHPNVNIISLVRKERSRFQNIPYWISNIRRIIKETKPEHIISFSMYVNIFTLLACIGLNEDILISERNDPSSDGRTWLDRLLTKVLYRNAKKIVFQTKRAQNCFSKKIQQRSRIIGNPISIGCKSVGEKVNKIVTVGRLEPQKNQVLLLRAFARSLKKYPDCKLEIYGKGNLLEVLKAECVRLNIVNSVFFMGSRDHIHEYLKDAKAFVLSSDFEGLSNALLEAMMMGLPCISTNCAGSDEVIEDGVNGMLVGVGDEIALSSAINKVLGDDDFANSIGIEASVSVARFKSEQVMEQWLDYIS